MELVEPGVAAEWEGSFGHLAQKGVVELRHFGGGEENDSLGASIVSELVVSNQTKDVGELITGRRKDSVVLGDVGVDRGFLRDTVDEYVVRVQDLASDLSDSLGDGGREHERLSLWTRRHLLRDVFNVLPEAHIQQCIGLVEHDLQTR